MIAAQRRAEILAHLERDGVVRVTDLAESLGVSDMTIRRDLSTLHELGILEKVHGGAVARTDPASSDEPGFAAKSARQRAEKEAIAARAASLVQPGQSIGVSAGTTTFAMARHLTQVPGLTVVTNSVGVADCLYRTQLPSQTVLLTGGSRTPSDALVGPIATTALASMHLDLVFLGVHGMDPRAGFTTPNLLESETNRALIDAGRRLVVLSDASKWGVVGLSTMAPLSRAWMLITDSGLSADARRELTDVVEKPVVVDALAGDEAWQRLTSEIGR